MCRAQLIGYDNKSGILGGKQSGRKQDTVLEAKNTEVNITEGTCLGKTEKGTENCQKASCSASLQQRPAGS